MHCLTALIYLNPDEYSQDLNCYPVLVKTDKCNGSCNTLNDFLSIICVPDKTDDLSLHVFDMITGIDKSKTIAKHISCGCICKFDGAIRNFN